MDRRASICLAACTALLFTQAVRADHIATLYANSAGSDGIQKFSVNVDAGTATQTAHYTGLGESNGRGVVVVGDTMYYTDAGSGSVFSFDLATNTNNGALFTVAGAGGLATAAWDGSHLILGDYTGTNNVYTYQTDGTLVSTVQLSKCAEIHQDSTAGFCDGLEFANNSLVSNEGDGGFGGPSQYDVYSLAGGSPTQAALITTTYGATGIAFDGTYYFVSDLGHDQLGIYDSTGAFVKFIPLTDGDHTFAIEDLSVDYNLVLNPTVPEPSTILLLGTGLLGLAWKIRRNRA
jgi:hypothetical protein